MTKKEEVLQAIKEMIKYAPADWAQQVATEMGKTKASVYAYAKGDRGVRRGMHIAVLTILKKIEETEQARTQELLK